MSDIQDSEANLPPDRTPGPVPAKPVPADTSGTPATSQNPAPASPAPISAASPVVQAGSPTSADPAVTAAPVQPGPGARPAAEATHAQAQQSAYSSLPPPPHHAGDAPWAQTWRFLTARLRQLSDKAGRRVMQRTLKIGVSARIFHPESGAKGLRSKTLQYLEESIAQWVMSRDVLVFMIPTVNTNGLVHPSNIRLRDYAKHLDGLVLQGGADVSPQSYAQAATRPEWSGDRVRDMYELELLHEFVEAGKPVLGICRGCQLINVAFGGTLYQDIATDVPTAILHVNDQYDSNYHALHFPQGSSLAGMVKTENAMVNSIHHQAVRDLGRDLSVEAVSGPDQIVEAIRYRKAPFVMGLQWHPEFHRAGGAELLDCTPILDSFLRAARETRF
ncbi:gamma-glutamyl-gamma-aminobutyrate hydrolase family protein [Herbaspirillum sp. AP02]|uniref:gamma-glutamyl-gamma-aminobutyrate hydrolase family protein n=1 Tax=unclassified Herbaspirillum TaxID=2624150 RepID=UPI0015D97411|nr:MULTISPECIES: type 1 glutamine amidotransferase [unclassified Herbaspirillum]MBG7620955.1 gamma-glutamyl-gamma-aminobutyrate hydrolase family protein [Herbaspirillum sp. AP02]NZD68418.1 gamma-glutamyl-gamma-aminobutyrate hydrolase family protein [Herbaspirillum sp. AP21]